MKTTLLFLLICTTAIGQHTLINLNGINTYEFGGQYATMGSSTFGLWGAYNGPFRAELSVDKYTSSFSNGTIFGARVTVPILKQSDNLPINILADGKYTRFQNSGFSSSNFYGGGIVSHQIKTGSAIISPFVSVGYEKFSSGGDLKWSIGGDAQVNNLVFGIEHGRTGGFGTTYVNFGYKFGGQMKSESDTPEEITDFETEEELALRESERQNAERLRREMAAADSLNQALEKAAQLQTEDVDDLAEQKRQEEEAELLKIERAKAEQIRQEQLRVQQLLADQRKAEEDRIKKEEANRVARANAERLRLEAEQIEIPRVITPTNSDNFSVQFFASVHGDKTFDNLSHVSSIIVEKVEGRNLYRYKLGFYSTREEAERIAEELKQLGYSGAFVKQE